MKNYVMINEILHEPMFFVTQAQRVGENHDHKLHVERHFRANETVRDIVIGMSDGLTVPFALAAGISGAGAATKIVVLAGLAEIAAGSIAMGLGSYLAAWTDFEHYLSEQQRENWEIDHLPEREKEEVVGVYRNYGMEEGHITPIIDAMSKNHAQWLDFMMRFELGLEPPTRKEHVSVR